MLMLLLWLIMHLIFIANMFCLGVGIDETKKDGLAALDGCC